MRRSRPRREVGRRDVQLFLDAVGPGPRKAKEYLFTGAFISAADAVEAWPGQSRRHAGQA